MIILYSISAFVLLIIVIRILMLTFKPLLRSEKAIRKWMLKKTPIGTSMDDIIKYVENKKWTIDTINKERGYNSRGVYPRTQIGKKYVKADIGHYRVILTTTVYAFWGFDENSKLIDTLIWKTREGVMLS